MPPTLTRGPLPARVYWTRRLVVAGLAFGLVFAFAHLFGGSSDATSKPQARQAAAQIKPTTASSDAAPTAGPTVPQGPVKQHRTKKDATPKPPPLAEPEGSCSDSDVSVTPAVHHAFAGGPVTMVMKLRTIDSPACTWTVSPDSLTVKITSGADDIWFSRECTRSIPQQDVVVRNTQTTKVELTWSGRRSDDTCSRYAGWAMPGWYHVSAAAYAGEPADVQFNLRHAQPTVVTKTDKPEPKSDSTKTGQKQSTKADSKKKDKKQKVD